MGAYFKSLSEDAGKRYVAKLRCIGLEIDQDPYLLDHESEYSSQMTRWPSLEFPNIYMYFISRPGTFTQEQLASWKQLEAYNYFKSGHVRTVYSRTVGSGEGKCVLLKALVNPSQKTPDKAHQAWVATKQDGTIISAHCTCMAG